MSKISLRQRALDLLARREHSRFELIRKLSQKEFPVDLVTETINQLTRENLQSDSRYTESYLRSRVNRGYGAIKIIAELHERKVDKELITEIFDKNSIDWFALAKELRIKKFGCNLPKDFTEQAKQSRFLQSRGFTAEQIHAAFTCK